MPDSGRDSAQDYWAVGFGYTVAVGNLYCPIDEFHRHAEQLLGRPILTHEFAEREVWEEMRRLIEQKAHDWEAARHAG